VLQEAANTQADSAGSASEVGDSAVPALTAADSNCVDGEVHRPASKFDALCAAALTPAELKALDKAC
jgi:hypothetical protein